MENSFESVVLKGYWRGAARVTAKSRMCMILKKTKLLRKHRPRTCELQVSDGRSSGTGIHRVRCEARLPGVDAHPSVTTHCISHPSPPLSVE